MNIEIKDLDKNMMNKAVNRVNRLIKPKGSLGYLEDIYIKLAGITGKLYPEIKKKSIIVMAADHGIVDEGISTSTSEITLFQAENMIRKITGVCALAHQAKADVVVVDIGINGNVKEKKVINRKIKYGTNNFLKEDAMTREEAIKSINVGIEIAEKEIKKGVNLLGTGEMGIGNTTASSAIVSVVCDLEPIEVTGIGANLPTEKVSYKADVIKRAINNRKPNIDDGIDILSKVGGLEIGGMAGVMLGGAKNGVPVVIDGFISTAAALIAYKINPKVLDYLIPSHKSMEKGAQVASKYLNLNPPLELGLRLGEGTGAAIMFNVIEAATYMNLDMVTFEEAGFEVK